MSHELVFKGFTPEIKDINTEKRSVTHLITNETADRGGDIVSSDGWVTDHYAKNPIVLADHRYSIFSIIGRAMEVRKSDSEKGLVASTVFHDKGPGAEAFELVKAKMARAWSVGFRGLKYDMITDDAEKGCDICVDAMKHAEDPVEKHIRGRHFKLQEMLEYSLVAIPMNPDIVMEAINSGMVSKRYVPLLFEFSADDIYIPGFVKREERREETKTTGGDGPAKPASTSSIALPKASRIYDSLLDVAAATKRTTLETQLKTQEDKGWVKK